MSHRSKLQLNSAAIDLLYVAMALILDHTTVVAVSPMTTNAFRMIPVHDVWFTEDVLWEKPARSRLECSVMCRGDGQCLMVTFQPGTHGPPGSCRSHFKHQSKTRAKQSAPRARSLVVVAADWIQKPCSSSSDCTEPMAACFSGQCLCDGGYFFDHTLNACVSSCWWGIGDTLLKYPGRDLDGHDMYTALAKKDPTRVCRAMCVADPHCLTIAFNRGWDKCYFKNVTAQHHPANWLDRNEVDFFQRTCARPGSGAINWIVY